MTRRCPECEQENSVNRQYCRGCGTDAAGFAVAQEAVGRMEKQRGEKRWSRVVKGAEEISSQLKLPGTKGQQLRQRASEWRKEAVGKLAEIEKLQGALKKDLGTEEYEQAEKTIGRILELDPNDESAGKLNQELPEKIVLESTTEAPDAQIAPPKDSVFQLALLSALKTKEQFSTVKATPLK